MAMKVAFREEVVHGKAASTSPELDQPNLSTLCTQGGEVYPAVFTVNEQTQTNEAAQVGKTKCEKTDGYADREIHQE